jgi:CRISPR-associated endonuclease/helicase Cas3
MAQGLAAGDFAAFFAAVHGTPPFPWQQRLLHHLAEHGVWPEVLDLPTGSGKTAALDIAVFHLALEASRGPERRAPIRIAFVVDRRLIVDDAFSRAMRLQSALGQPEAAIVEQAALALRTVAGDDQPPLLVRRLRGGAPREDDWARTPVQPTILCSTVDQVGSRLLFRGYGISDRMKPIHAGLLGSDCLILLDEAHLAEPFRQTLAAVGRRRQGDRAPWGTAVLTATPGKRTNIPFELQDDDRRHPILSARLAASKPATLIEIAGKQGVPADDRRIETIAEQTKEALRVLRETIPIPAMGVVVNRVGRARAVFERLKDELTDATVILIIGPARSIDRERQAIEQLRLIRTGAERTMPKPLIVVATQTIEAGVDIDLDGLVTEIAPLDALRQRFGRLNRAGRAFAPVATIVAHRDDIGVKADDPVYGDRIAKTWNALLNATSGSLNDCVDFGIDPFPRELIDAADDIVSQKPDAPIVLPAYADLWSQTSPIPNADPEVALFLHGPDRKPASLQVVWRADIREADLADRNYILEILRLVPPRSAEALEIPLWTARGWLRNQSASLATLSDASEREPDDLGTSRGKRVFRYAGADNERSGAVASSDLRDGDLIVVPAAYGGCDEWGWNPNSPSPVMDVAELAAEPYSARRFAVRLTPEILDQELRRDAVGDGVDFVDAESTLGARLYSKLAEHENERALALLEQLLDIDRLPSTVRGWLDSLKRHRGRLERYFVYGHDDEDRPEGVIFIAPFGVRKLSPGDDLDDLRAAPPSTESDDIGSASGYEQTLAEHSDWVREAATAFAGRAGLSAAIAADIGLAAYLHDAGKADPRFQVYLAGGNAWEWERARVLAKSGRQSLPGGAWEKAALPDYWRHEALSVRLALNLPEFAGAHDPALVLWLVGVHHGLGRPLFPHQDPLDLEARQFPDVPGLTRPLKPGFGPQSLAFDFAGRDWPQIFEDLKHRYGIWGLARLEAFVRLADHRASESAARRYGDRQIAEPTA